MAQVKFTSSDVFARLAKGECANFRNGACVKGAPCTIINGEPCDYFAKYVKPLLDFPEFNAKYSREAKVSVALNPKAKVVRRRRNAAEPALSLDAAAKHETQANRKVAAKPVKTAAPPPVAAKAPEAPKPVPVEAPAKPVEKHEKEVAVTTTVGIDGAVRTRPQTAVSTPLPPHSRPPVKAREHSEPAQQQQLLFDMPAAPAVKRPASKRR